MALATQLKEKIGSVGASWPPGYDRHNNRIKGFCGYTIMGEKTLKHMDREIASAEGFAPQATRTTIRAFMRRGLAEEIENLAPGFSVEARFDAGNAIRNHELVYLARNRMERMPDHEVISNELASVRALGTLGRVSHEEASERIRRAGYRLERLASPTDEDVRRLLLLYREAYEEYTFDITPETIHGMLNNGNVVIVGRGADDQVVSCLIAEHAVVGIDNGLRTHLYELSDYATFRSERGNGLITLMQMEVIATLRALDHGPRSIIYSEDRAPWTAVNRSSMKAGMDYCGTLLQHCVLVSDRDIGEHGRFEDLNVWVHNP